MNSFRIYTIHFRAFDENGLGTINGDMKMNKPFMEEGKPANETFREFLHKCKGVVLPAPGRTTAFWTNNTDGDHLSCLVKG
jgi:hypothetical protein